MAWLPLPWPSRYVNITCYTWLQCVRSQMGVCTQSQLFSLPLISIVQFPSIQIFNLSNLWLWRCFPYCPSYWKMSRCRNNKPNSYTFMCVWIPVCVHTIHPLGSTYTYVSVNTRTGTQDSVGSEEASEHYEYTKCLFILFFVSYLSKLLNSHGIMVAELKSQNGYVSNHENSFPANVFQKEKLQFVKNCYINIRDIYSGHFPKWKTGKNLKEDFMKRGREKGGKEE